MSARPAVRMATACLAGLLVVRTLRLEAQVAGAATLKSPVPATTASVEQGHAVFLRFCSRCHGDEGKGDGRQAPEGSHPANLTDEHWDHGSTHGEIVTTIRDGIGPKYDMDSYEGKISDTDIWNVVNYLRSIGPKPANR